MRWIIPGNSHCSNPMMSSFCKIQGGIRKAILWIFQRIVRSEKRADGREMRKFCGDCKLSCGYAAFYRKWVTDVRDCQREDGRVDKSRPKIRGKDSRNVLNGAAGWADAAVTSFQIDLWKHMAMRILFMRIMI